MFIRWFKTRHNVIYVSSWKKTKWKHSVLFSLLRKSRIFVWNIKNYYCELIIFKIINSGVSLKHKINDCLKTNVKLFMSLHWSNWTPQECNTFHFVFCIDRVNVLQNMRHRLRKVDNYNIMKVLYKCSWRTRNITFLSVYNKLIHIYDWIMSQEHISW